MLFLAFLFFFFSFGFSAMSYKEILLNSTEEVFELIRDRPLSVLVFFSEVNYSAVWHKSAAHYAKTAETLREYGADIPMGLVNLDKFPEFKTIFNVKPYPYFKMFTYGQGRDQRYSSNRHHQDMVRFIMKEYHQFSKEIKTEEKLRKVLEEHCHVAIYYGPAMTETYKDFCHTSVTFESDTMFYHVTDPELIKKYSGNNDPNSQTIIFYENFGKDSFELITDGPKDPETIKDFILHHIYHQSFEMAHKHHYKIMEERIPMLLVALGENQESKRAKRAFNEVVPRLQRKILLSVADYYDPDFDSYFGNGLVKEDQLPGVFIFSFYNDTRARYRYRGGKVTADGIEEFFWQWKNKTIRPQILSVTKSYHAPHNETTFVKVCCLF
jgi:Thioredoxin-like domain